MATNTTIPPEEEKQPLQKPGDLVLPTYAPPAPKATYDGSDQAAIMQQMIADYVSRTDPQAQAEQDAKMQRGRQFWTGANLFANVVANAINAGGTAKGAPNMTWNDNASQKMYDTWRDQDKELKADRKAAQQRLDALRLQDAQFRMADKQAQDKAALDAYNKQFGLDKDAAVAKYNAEMDEYKTQRGWQHDDEVYEKKLADAREDAKTEYQRKLALANIRNSGSGTSTNKTSNYDIYLGSSVTIPANENDARKKLNDLSYQIVRRINASINAQREELKKRISEEKNLQAKAELEKQLKEIKPISNGGTSAEQAAIINMYGGDMYEDDEDFRNWVDRTYGINGNVKVEGQYQRRPSVKKNPMMTAPDLSQERTDELTNWLTKK